MVPREGQLDAVATSTTPRSPRAATSASTRATELSAKLRSAGLDLRGHHRAHALHSPYWWLKCAVGPRNDEHPLVVKYREFLEWDIMKQPTSTRIADRVLSPAIGKSIVFYAAKPAVKPAGSAHA